MEYLVRDDVVLEAAGEIEMKLVRSDGRGDCVPAAVRCRRAERDRAKSETVDRKVFDGDVDRSARRGVAPTAVEGIRALRHPQDLAGLLLADGCGGARRGVAAPMNPEVIAGKRCDAARGKRVDCHGPWHA